MIRDHEVLFPKSKDEPLSPPAQKNDLKKPPVARSSVGWDATEDTISRTDSFSNTVSSIPFLCNFSSFGVNSCKTWPGWQFGLCSGNGHSGKNYLHVLGKADSFANKVSWPVGSTDCDFCQCLMTIKWAFSLKPIVERISCQAIQEHSLGWRWDYIVHVFIRVVNNSW